jgi:hypothetical protein
MENNMRNLLIAVLFAFFAVSAQAGTIYKWTDENGTFSVTDDIKRVPVKYRAKAVAGEMPAIKDYDRLTTVDTSSRVALGARLERLRSEATTTTTDALCAGHATVEQIRRTYKERGNTYNGMFYVARNSCGDVTSVTRVNPQVQIELEQ